MPHGDSFSDHTGQRLHALGLLNDVHQTMVPPGHSIELGGLHHEAAAHDDGHIDTQSTELLKGVVPRELRRVNIHQNGVYRQGRGAQDVEGIFAILRLDHTIAEVAQHANCDEPHGSSIIDDAAPRRGPRR